MDDSARTRPFMSIGEIAVSCNGGLCTLRKPSNLLTRDAEQVGKVTRLESVRLLLDDIERARVHALFRRDA